MWSDIVSEKNTVVIIHVTFLVQNEECKCQAVRDGVPLTGLQLLR